MDTDTPLDILYSVEHLNSFWDKTKSISMANDEQPDKHGNAQSVLCRLQHFEESLLERPAINVMLRDYLQAHHCEEVLLFYNDYKFYLSTNAQSLRNKRGSAMAMRYIHPQAPHQLNLSHQCTTHFLHRVQRDKQYHRDSFDGIVTEVMHLMKYSIWPRFTSHIHSLQKKPDSARQTAE